MENKSEKRKITTAGIQLARSNDANWEEFGSESGKRGMANIVRMLVYMYVYLWACMYVLGTCG